VLQATAPAGVRPETIAPLDVSNYSDYADSESVSIFSSPLLGLSERLSTVMANG